MTGSSLEGNFHIANQHYCAVLLNKDTFHTEFSGFVHAHSRLMGGRRHGCHRQVPQGSRHGVLVFHDRQHPHQQQVRQADFRLHFPAPPDPRLALSAVALTGDFNKAVERELPAGEPNGQRRLSSIDEAFNHVSNRRLTLGVSPLWGPGAEPHGHKWPDCCGFVVFPTRSASG